MAGRPNLNARSRGVGTRGVATTAAPIGGRSGRSAGSKVGTSATGVGGSTSRPRERLTQPGRTGGALAAGFGGNPKGAGARAGGPVAGRKTAGGAKPQVNANTAYKGIGRTGNA